MVSHLDSVSHYVAEAPRCYSDCVYDEAGAAWIDGPNRRRAEAGSGTEAVHAAPPQRATEAEAPFARWSIWWPAPASSSSPARLLRKSLTRPFVVTTFFFLLLSNQERLMGTGGSGARCGLNWFHLVSRFNFKLG